MPIKMRNRLGTNGRASHRPLRRRMRQQHPEELEESFDLQQDQVRRADSQCAYASRREGR